MTAGTVSGYWLVADGSYYEGDQQAIIDQPVPQRPSPLYDWVGGTGWVINATRQAKAAASLVADIEFNTVQGQTIVKNFLGISSTGLDAYVDATVVDLASARTVLKILARIVHALAVKAYQ